jgi:uncharacterized protein YcbX
MVLSQILIYPVKSLDGVSVREARINAGGILEGDRSYALFDSDGKYVNAKRTPRIQLLRAEFDSTFEMIILDAPGADHVRHFSLVEPDALNDWLSKFFGFPVYVKRETTRGFPDDRTAPGPTICSEASLREVTAWFPGLTLESARRRFRTNLELSGAEPFGEDRLFGLPDTKRPFRLGDVKFCGHNPCQRCVVPSRDPDKAEATAQFQKKFTEMRQKTLPPWSQPLRFNHYYRFAVNTSIPGTESGKMLRVGDRVQLEPDELSF